jgi:hypothetical protein
MAASGLKKSDLGSKMMTYATLFAPDGSLKFKKDKEVSIFDTLDAIMKLQVGKNTKLTIPHLIERVENCSF